jgi:thiamine biosynthesis lipoprotein
MMRRAQPWLGTLVEITIADALDDADLHLAFDRAFEAIAATHRLMSFHDPDSDVSRINRAAPAASIIVDARSARVLAAALALSEQSEGVFNPLCASRLVEWDYLPAPAGGRPEWDTPASVLDLQGCRVIKHAPAWIDLGGIAKGYAVDAAAAALAASGIQSACVNAGGDLLAFGADAWPVLVRDPAHPGAAGHASEVRDCALATSAIYFSRKEHKGRPCSALLHGREGWPVLRAASVSVSAPSCMMADALTKVVAATGDIHHPALGKHGAAAYLI